MCLTMGFYRSVGLDIYCCRRGYPLPIVMLTARRGLSRIGYTNFLWSVRARHVRVQGANSSEYCSQLAQKVRPSGTPQSPVQAKNDQAECRGSASEDGRRNVLRTKPKAQERQQRGLAKNNDGECAGQKAVAAQTNNQRRKKHRETQRLPKGRKNGARLDSCHCLQIGNGNHLYRIAEPKPHQALRHKKQQELRRPVKRIDARQSQD